MPRADFYIIDTPRTEDRDIFACRYVNRAWSQGKRVYVLTRSEAQSEALDELLWSFRADSFIPHEILGRGDPDDFPVLIGHQPPPTSENGVLLNLSGRIPECHDQFERISEIFNHADQADLGAARETFRLYRQLGYEPNHHKIQQVT